MAPTYSRINTRGQLVIPAKLRQAMKLSAGTKVSIQRCGDTLMLCPITTEFIDSLIGCTQGAGDEREATHRNGKTRSN